MPGTERGINHTGKMAGMITQDTLGIKTSVQVGFQIEGEVSVAEAGVEEVVSCMETRVKISGKIENHSQGTQMVLGMKLQGSQNISHTSVRMSKIILSIHLLTDLGGHLHPAGL